MAGFLIGRARETRSGKLQASAGYVSLVADALETAMGDLAKAWPGYKASHGDEVAGLKQQIDLLTQENESLRASALDDDDRAVVSEIVGAQSATSGGSGPVVGAAQAASGSTGVVSAPTFSVTVPDSAA